MSESSKKHSCPRCRRFLRAFREMRERLVASEQENVALREELLAAGEMVDDLARELEKLQS